MVKRIIDPHAAKLLVYISHSFETEIVQLANDETYFDKMNIFISLA